MVFQDPCSSLNPRMTLRQIIGDPLVATGEARGSELHDRIAEMMRRVGLSPDYMTAARTRSPAGSGSASTSPGPSSWSPSWWSRTSR
jgi:ABC-type antimicrobial peptide transport system ATPase subunit